MVALAGKPEDELGYVNVSTVDAIKRVLELMSSPALPHYLAFHVANEVQCGLMAEQRDGVCEAVRGWERAREGKGRGQGRRNRAARQDGIQGAIRMTATCCDSLNIRKLDSLMIFATFAKEI